MKYSKNVKDISNWIKKSVNTLLTTDYTCSRYELDDELAIYIGWQGGFDDKVDNTIYQNKDDKSFAICMKIASTKEMVWADFEFNDMPYNKDGEVYDTDSSIGVNDDFDELAEWYLSEYKNIRTLIDTNILIV